MGQEGDAWEGEALSAEADAQTALHRGYAGKGSAEGGLLGVDQRDALQYAPAVVHNPLYGHAVTTVDEPLTLFAAVAGVSPDRGVPPLELLRAVVVVGAVVARVQALVERRLALELAVGVVQILGAVLLPVSKVSFTH